MVTGSTYFYKAFSYDGTLTPDYSSGLTANATVTAGVWTSLGNSGVTTVLYSVSVVDNNVAFVSGNNGVVLKTVNGGTNWTNISAAPISTTVSCDVVRALDANTILTTQYDGANGHMYKTTNGGTTWTEVLYQAGGFFDDIRFNDANNGFMYGDPVGDVGHYGKPPMVVLPGIIQDYIFHRLELKQVGIMQWLYKEITFGLAQIRPYLQK